MIGLISYGLGNIKAFENIYKKLNIPCMRVKNPSDLEKVEKLILPGVGSFDNAMSKLIKSNLLDTINHKVKDEKIPILGVCVGMQIMSESSEEGALKGLGWIKGRVKKFKPSSFKSKPFNPHMGWNSISPRNESVIFNNIHSLKFYFLHSYYLDPELNSNIISSTIYGLDFCSAINQENVWATQFHPEKSHDSGIKLLENFSKL